MLIVSNRIMTKVTIDTGEQSDVIFLHRLKYVLNFIENHPNSSDQIKLSINDLVDAEIVIQYSAHIGDFQIIPQNVLFRNSKVKIEVLKETTIVYDGHELKGFCNNGGSLFIPFDIFETIFFHISRYEEWFCEEKNLDLHGTLLSSHQYLVKNNIHQIPLVDLLICYFLEKIGLQPKISSTKFTLSHDIDVLLKYPSFYKFLRGFGNILLYQKDKIKKFVRHTINYIKSKHGINTDPYDTFDWILMANNPKINQKTIYWLSGGKTQFEGFFDISDPKVQTIMLLSKNHGYKTGLHPSYNTIDDKSMMESEWKKLCKVSKEEISDFRQHFLRFDVKKTGKILDELEAKTESSLGYRDRIGFRCGTGFPYRLYNFEAESAFNFIEIPLVVMDIAAMREADWNSSAWCDLITSFLERNKNATHITFNFHNSFFDPALVDADLIKTWYIKTFNVET